jgi:hypothetical protein
MANRLTPNTVAEEPSEARRLEGWRQARRFRPWFDTPRDARLLTMSTK